MDEDLPQMEYIRNMDRVLLRSITIYKKCRYKNSIHLVFAIKMFINSLILCNT